MNHQTAEIAWAEIFGEGEEDEVLPEELRVGQAAVGHQLVEDENGDANDREKHDLGNLVARHAEEIGRRNTALPRGDAERLLHEAVAGKKDEDVHAVVPEEGDERVEGVKGIGGNLLDRVSEGRLSKGHLVFAREGLDLMEEVVRGDEEDGQCLEDGGVVSGKLRAAKDRSLVEMSEPLHVAYPVSPARSRALRGRSMAPVGRTTIPARGRRKTGVWKGHPLTAAFARCLIMSVTHRVTAPLFDTASDFAFGNNLQTFIYDTFLEPTVPQAKRKGYEKADEKRGGGSENLLPCSERRLCNVRTEDPAASRQPFSSAYGDGHGA